MNTEKHQEVFARDSAGQPTQVVLGDRVVSAEYAKQTGASTALRDNVWQSGAIYNCQQCKRVMSVLDYMLGSVCMDCCRKNHRKVIGR